MFSPNFVRKFRPESVGSALSARRHQHKLIYLRIAVFPYLLVPFRFFCFCCCSLRSRPQHPDRRTFIFVCTVQPSSRHGVLQCVVLGAARAHSLLRRAHKLIECCPSIIKINNIFSFTIMAVHFSVNGCCGVRRTIRHSAGLVQMHMRCNRFQFRYTCIFSPSEFFPQRRVMRTACDATIHSSVSFRFSRQRNACQAHLSQKAKLPFVTDGVVFANTSRKNWKKCLRGALRAIFASQHFPSSHAVCNRIERIWPITMPPLG